VPSRNPASIFELVNKITALHVHHAFSRQRFLCRPFTTTTWKWTHFKLTWESQGGKFYWLSTVSHLYCYNLISLHKTWWLGIMAKNVEQREVNLIFKQRSDREVPNYNGCVGDQVRSCYFDGLRGYVTLFASFLKKLKFVFALIELSNCPQYCCTHSPLNRPCRSTSHLPFVRSSV